jgi:putative membrane protein
MSAMHEHGDGLSPDALLLTLAGGAVLVYVIGVRMGARRGRTWPASRILLWVAGIGVAAASVVGPLAEAAHTGFVAHMWAHLLGGMVAPLLLVLAAPVTLALRSLAPTPARRLSRILHTAPARVVAHPVTAAVLSAGGLWAIYLTPFFASMRGVPLVHVLVHAHLLVAGYLFTAAIIGLDPAPHPPPRALVATVLVLAIASHGILAKYLYAHPPAGAGVGDVQQGAQLMYYGGAWVEAVLIVIFCARWYRAAGRRLSDTPPAPTRARR